TGLTAINAQVVTPPECGANAFANVDKSITLFVPEESEEWLKSVFGESFMTPLPGWTIGAQKTRVIYPDVRLYRNQYKR
ncbi:MAG: hypothetical protein ACSW8I_08295, partial [bacterium]